MHSPLACVQFKAIQIVRNLLEAHDIDPRLANDKQSRTRIAYLYFPFLNLIIHFIPFIISTIPYKNNFKLHGYLDNENELSTDFDCFMAELNLTDERKLDECWSLNELLSDNFEIDDYYFDDYDLNFLIDSQSKLEENESSGFYSLYPMFDNFKLEDDFLESNEEILNYISRL